MIYAVIDTKVLVSALLSKNKASATVKVYDAIADGTIIPLYNKEIIEEYEDVPHGKKFGFDKKRVSNLLSMTIKYGVEVFPRSTGAIFDDMDDLVFYEVVMEKLEDNSYLVTGNIKHYPERSFIVTPDEMMGIITGGAKNAQQ